MMKRSIFLFLFSIASLVSLAQGIGIYPQVTASGTNTYTVSLSGVNPAPQSYVTGARYQVKFTNANTGASTIKFGNLATVPLVKNGSTPLSAGDISPNQILVLVFDGTNMQVIGGGSNQGGQFVPQSRTLTINGVQYDLSSDRSWTITASGIEVNVDSYGAVGNGIIDDSGAIQSAIQAAGLNGVVRFSPGKTYMVGENIPLLASTTLIGYGSTIKRANAKSSTTSGIASIGATSVTVVDPTQFKVGDKVIGCNILLTNGGRGYNENSSVGFTTPHTIVSIVGNTLNLSSGLGIALPANSVIVKVYRLFDGVDTNTTITGTGNKIFGIHFDGNKANNNFTNSWTHNSTMALGPKSIVQNCSFMNTPAENIFICNNTIVTNNIFSNLNGSFVHISQNNGSFNGYVNISNNIGDGASIATQAVSFHCEGAITLSAYPERLIVQGNQFKNCTEGFIGPVPYYGPFIQVHNNTCFGARYVLTATDEGSGNITHLSVKDNVFKDCGYILISGIANNQRTEKDATPDLIAIENNKFINMKLVIERASGFSIAYNEFITESAFTYSTSSAVSGTGRSASIALTGCVQYKISNNTFDNRNTTLDAQITHAIICEFSTISGNVVGAFVKTDAVTNTEYKYFGRNVVLSNNRIYNYRNGISDYNPILAQAPRDFSWLSFLISNNQIVLHPAATLNDGIIAGPGCIVHDNKIYGTSSTRSGISLDGVSDGGSSFYSGTARLRLNGPICYRNTIIGPNVSIVVARSQSGGGFNSFNCQVRDNYIDGSVTDNSAGNSTIVGNITLINENTTIQVIRTNPEWY